MFVMIINMSNPEIQPMLNAIGTINAPDSYETNTFVSGIKVYPNPVNADGIITFELNKQEIVRIDIFTINGIKLATVWSGETLSAGKHSIELSQFKLLPGTYISRIYSESKVPEMKKIIVN
jgi:hypothetical protein